jgi:predicted transcriptional regulator
MPKDVVVFLKLSQGLSDKLLDLAEQVGRNRCEVLRALVASASVEHLPRAWQDADEAAVLAEIEG